MEEKKETIYRFNGDEALQKASPGKAFYLVTEDVASGKSKKVFMPILVLDVHISGGPERFYIHAFICKKTKNAYQGLKCESMYSNISSYIDSAKNALANITVTISEEARDNIKEGVQKGVQEAYVDERKKHIDELETYKKEFLVSFKRDLNDAALEVVDDVRKSYKGMFWRTLIIATAFMFITLTALIKIFGDAYAWLAIVGMLLVGVDFCVWVYRYLKMFGSK